MAIHDERTSVLEVENSLERIYVFRCLVREGKVIEEQARLEQRILDDLMREVNYRRSKCRYPFIELVLRYLSHLVLSGILSLSASPATKPCYLVLGCGSSQSLV